jgi:tetratricopeptide (TPR) repeat protein
MKKTQPGIVLAALVVATLLLSPAATLASGSGSMSAPAPAGGMQMPRMTPEQEAASLYNDGISYRDKAAKLEKEAEAENDAGKRQKLEAKAKDKHEDSIKKFSKATEKNPNLFVAWGSLGYAYRKIGKYNESLAAYGKALEIQPNYTPAIEYRAEAYLGLGRLDEVKSVYMTLFNMDRPRADELAAAIDKWLEKKKADPTSVDPAQLEDFSKWAQQRKQLASQVSSVFKSRNERW